MEWLNYIDYKLEELDKLKQSLEIIQSKQGVFNKITEADIKGKITDCIISLYGNGYIKKDKFISWMASSSFFPLPFIEKRNYEFI